MIPINDPSFEDEIIEEGWLDMPDELQMQIGADFTPVVVPKDVYSAAVVSIRDVAFEERNCWALTFEIQDGQQIGKRVDGIASAMLSEKSKLAIWLSAMGLKLEIGEKVNKSDIIGKRCRIITDTKKRKFRDESVDASFVAAVLSP